MLLVFQGCNFVSFKAAHIRVLHHCSLMRIMKVLEHGVNIELQQKMYSVLTWLNLTMNGI